MSGGLTMAYATAALTLSCLAAFLLFYFIANRQAA